jgi:hypothetical protein
MGFSHWIETEAYVSILDKSTSGESGMQQILSQRVQEITSLWKTISIQTRILFTFTLSMLLYIPTYIYSDLLIFVPVRIVAGLISVLIIPGAIIAERTLPKEYKGLGASIIVGLLLNSIEIQIGFLSALILNIKLSGSVWILIINPLIVLSYYLYSQINSKKSTSFDSFTIGVKGRVLHIIVLGLCLRLVVLFFAQNSLAPDAALYSDYARGVIEGSYSTRIIDDGRVYSLWNGVEYCFHQGFTYLFAVSWMLITPGAAGPTLVLTIAGMAIILVSYQVAERFYNRIAASCVVILLSFHPLFVYHSAVAYGPEITSLMFVLGAFTLLVSENEGGYGKYFLGGLLFGLSDVVWYSNYLLFCVALPFFLIIIKEKTGPSAGLFFVGMPFAILARVFYTNIVAFNTTWIALFLVLGIILVARPHRQYLKTAAFFVGTAAVMYLWRWPVQIVYMQKTISAATHAIRSFVGTLQAANPDISVLLRPLNPEIIPNFLFYILFHATIVLFLLLPIAIYMGRKSSASFGFLSMSIIGAGGTFVLFSSFSYFKEVLLPIYIFSDSRFFLSISLMGVLALGGAFAQMKLDFTQPAGWIPTKEQRKKISASIVLAVTLIGFVPGYFLMPAGLDLINYEARYGWVDMVGLTSSISDDDAIFLVDRSTEFSWITAQSSVKLRLTGTGLRYRDAISSIVSQSIFDSARYFVLDSYTIARWNTFHPLLYEPLSIGNTMIGDGSLLNELTFPNQTEQVAALTLVGETVPNNNGEYVRVFEFSQDDFFRVWHVNNLGNEWSATQGGIIINSTYSNQLTVGAEVNETYLTRSVPLDLDITPSGGFLIAKLIERNATVNRMEVIDNLGSIITEAFRIDDFTYFAIIGDQTVGDLRIYISGHQGDAVTIVSMAIWQAT